MKLKLGQKGDIISPDEIKRETKLSINVIQKQIDTMVKNGQAIPCILPRCPNCGSFQMDVYDLKFVQTDDIYCIFCGRKIDDIYCMSQKVYQIL